METFHKVKILQYYKHINIIQERVQAAVKFHLSSNVYSEANHLTSYNDYNMQTNRKVTILLHCL